MLKQTDVYVAFGHGFESIVRYYLTTGAFTRGADHPSDCTQGFARYINPVAVVGNNILTHGGYATGNAWCLDTDSMKLPLPGMAAWAPVNANLDPRLGHIFVEFGGRLLFGGGRRITPPTNADCRAAGLWFIDPATDTKTPLTPFPRPRLDPNFPNDLPNVSFVVRTGRGVMVWGGNHVSCSNGTLRAFAGGSIGVASATGNDIVWAALPDAGEPTARHFGADSTGFCNRQHSWTGYEATVLSGHEFNGTVDVLTFNGSTYQPPVGCVCPSADAEACDGGTNLPSPNECAPQ